MQLVKSNLSLTIDKLSKRWGLSYTDTFDLIQEIMCGKEWSEEFYSQIDFAGIIDNDSIDKIYGHNGYWIGANIGDNQLYVVYVTNGNAYEGIWNESIADDIGADWDSWSIALSRYAII
jgi:hypothetical protein